MDRPTRDQMFMAMAHIVARRSTCYRNHVGCIITDLEGTSVVSMGYNGNARGLKNGCDSEEPGKCGCVHAETNALIKAPYQGPRLRLYTTVSPCRMCAKLILNSRVEEVFFAELYRDDGPIKMLDEALRARGGGVWLLPHFDLARTLGLGALE